MKNVEYFWQISLKLGDFYILSPVFWFWFIQKLPFFLKSFKSFVGGEGGWLFWFVS